MRKIYEFFWYFNCWLVDLENRSLKKSRFEVSDFEIVLIWFDEGIKWMVMEWD